MHDACVLALRFHRESLQRAQELSKSLKRGKNGNEAATSTRFQR